MPHNQAAPPEVAAATVAAVRVGAEYEDTRAARTLVLLLLVLRIGSEQLCGRHQLLAVPFCYQAVAVTPTAQRPTSHILSDRVWIAQGDTW
jgi:hypothetical protein